MYRFDYDASGNDQARVSPMIFNVKVYAIAEKYNVSALKSQAKDKFEKAVETCWDMDDFPHAIAYVYASTPDRGLRDLVVGIVCKYIKALLEKQDFQNVLKETTGFAADVTQLLTQKIFSAPRNDSALKKYECLRCGSVWEAVLSSGPKYHCMYCGSLRSD